MKPYFLIIPLLFITSCTNDRIPETNIKIQSLEKQVQELKDENTKIKSENDSIKREIANIKEENVLLKAGWIPPTDNQMTGLPPWTKIMDNNSLFPEWSTFEETNGEECMKKAHDNYIKAGITKCIALGYKEADIKKDKCQLDTTFIQSLQKKKTNEEAACGPQ